MDVRAGILRGEDGLGDAAAELNQERWNESGLRLPRFKRSNGKGGSEKIFPISIE